MFRLHIDIPLENMTVEQAQLFVQDLMTEFKDKDIVKDSCYGGSVIQVNYRLGHDDDRQRSNYMQINENGHCSNKKSKLIL